MRYQNQLYNIYCDESCHLENDNIKPMLLGAIWCPDEKKSKIFNDLKKLKVKHDISSKCELKWNAVSNSKIDYYKDVTNFFFDNENLHFRALIVPDKSKLNHAFFNQTHDDFYYKMYFDLLKIILDPKYSYNIYLDIKDTQGQKKVNKLHEYLCNSQYDFNKKMIKKIQQVNSQHVELIQLTDFLLGAVAYTHRRLNTSTAKLSLIEQIKIRSGYSLLYTTLYKENKMNIFVWKGKEV